MKMSFSDLWRSNGMIGRGAYALVGLLGFALKHNLDRLVALGFHRPWGLFNYWVRRATWLELLASAAARPCFWERWWRCRCRSSG